MEAVLAFYFGWVMGARSGQEGVDDLTTAFTSLRQSEEFTALVIALRKHGAYLLRSIADVVDSGEPVTASMPDVLAKVYELIYPAANQQG
jgi:hypothetical protein